MPIPGTDPRTQRAALQRLFTAAMACGTLVLAGCGSGGNDPDSTPLPASPAPANPAPTPPAPPPPTPPAPVPPAPVPPAPVPPAPGGPVVLGTWADVTPTDADLTHKLGCDNFGVGSVQVDPLQPSDLYAHFDCQGLWKSTDHGLTWNGPIDTGRNGPVARDCAGGIAIGPGTPGQPVIYRSCIRGNALWVGGRGFWKSTNGGVDWTGYTVAPGADRQDFYAPSVDPSDPQHLLMAGHEMNVLAESRNGGETWTNVPQDPRMNEQGGTACIAFVQTADPATRGKTFLWLAQHTGGAYGTWRTEDGGAHWDQVDHNEHAHGGCQIYQPDGGNVVYMAGAYSQLGWGVLRSIDYGKTWTRVSEMQGTTVFGSAQYVYATQGGGAMGLGASLSPAFQVAAQPGTGAWQQPATPAAMKLGPGSVATTSDGHNTIFVGATGGAGLWRYVEP